MSPRKLLSISLLLLATHNIFAQATPSTTSSTDPEVLKLQTQQAIMDAKVGILQDQQKATIGMLPSSNVAPKQGSVSPSGDQPIQGRVIAYSAADLLAKQIAIAVCKAVHPPLDDKDPRRKVVIYDSAEIASIVNYQAFVQQLNFIHDQFEGNAQGTVQSAAKKAIAKGQNETNDFAPPPPLSPGAGQPYSVAAALVPGLVEGGLKSIIDIIGLFRTDTSITGKDFTTDDNALVAATAAELRIQGCVVYEPAVEPVAMFDTGSELISNLSNLRGSVGGLQLQLATVKNTLQQQSDSLGAIVQAQAALDSLNKSRAAETDPKKKRVFDPQISTANSAVQQAIRSWQVLTNSTAIRTAQDAQVLKVKKDNALADMGPISGELTGISTALDGLQSALFKSDDFGQAVMSNLLRAEKLYRTMTYLGADQKRMGDAYVLTETMAALTGGMITKQNFWIPTRVFYNGGSIATFTLFGPGGEVVGGGTLTKRSNNVRAVNEDGKSGAPSQFFPCNATTGELCGTE